MAKTKNILTTELLTGLTWSGSEKKTANVPAGSGFTFNHDYLPDFPEVYPNPERFTIFYRRASSSSANIGLICNYVSNGATRYTFSYKLDNDVINLSVFKSDGHLEINVRNNKLHKPMNLDEVEFRVTYQYDVPVNYDVEPAEGGNLTGAERVVVDTDETIELTINEGYELSELSGYTLTTEGDEIDLNFNKIDDTHYSYHVDYPRLNNIFASEVYIYANLNEIQPEEYPIELYNYQHCNPTVEPNTYIQGETTFTITVNPEEGYELDYILIQNLDGVTDYYRGTELTHLAEWSGEPDPMMPENPWGYRVTVVCKEIPVIEYSINISETEHGIVVADKEKAVAGELITLTITPDEGYELDSIEVKDSDDNVISTTETFNMPESDVTVNVIFKEIPVPPTPGECDLIFTTTFNRYAIVDVLVKEDGSAGVVNVRRLTDDDVDLDDTYETVLRAACTFRQDLIVGVEVEMNKPDNVASNYTVKNTKIFINGEEI